MPEVIHCRVRGCEASKKVKNFEEGMEWLWHHRKHKHPAKFKESQEKARKTRQAGKRQ